MVEKIDPSSKTTPPMTKREPEEGVAAPKTVSPKGVADVPDTLETTASEEENQTDPKATVKSSSQTSFLEYCKQAYDKLFATLLPNGQKPGAQQAPSEKPPSLEKSPVEALFQSKGEKSPFTETPIEKTPLAPSLPQAAKESPSESLAAIPTEKKPLAKPESRPLFLTGFAPSSKELPILSTIFGFEKTSDVEGAQITPTSEILLQSIGKQAQVLAPVLQQVFTQMEKEGIHPLTILTHVLTDPAKKLFLFSQTKNMSLSPEIAIALQVLASSLEKSKEEKTLMPYLKEFAETVNLDYPKLETYVKNGQWQECIQYLLSSKEPNPDRTQLAAATLTFAATPAAAAHMAQPNVIVTALPINPPFVLSGKGKRKNVKKDKNSERDQEEDSAEDSREK